MDPRQKLERARQATHTLRDAAREGRVIDFRKRDPLVLAIHDIFDAYEALLAAPVVTPAAEPSGWHDIDTPVSRESLLNPYNWLRVALEAPTDILRRKRAESAFERLSMALGVSPLDARPQGETERGR